MERDRAAARAGRPRRHPRHRRPALQGDRTLEGIAPLVDAKGTPREAAGLARRHASAVVAIAFGAFGVGLGGYYWDVSWHADLGRDRTLFTIPHTLVLVSLGLVLTAAMHGLTFVAGATIRERLRAAPRALLALGALGGASVAAFPLDQVWHATFGPDVLLWSPSHLLLILGPSLAPLAVWLLVRDMGVRAESSVRASWLHLALGAMTLAGLSAVQAEFDVGVVTRSLLYQPVLVTIAGAFALVAARIVLGPGGALRVCAVAFATRIVAGWTIGVGLDRTMPRVPLYLGAALTVELAALVVRSRSRLRFGLMAGVSVATIGLAGEWAWTAATGRHAWSTALAPRALLLAVPAGVGAATLGAAFAASVRGERFGGRAPVALAGAMVLLGLIAPFPTTSAPVSAQVTVERVGDELLVHATPIPPGAARDATWFEVLAWQGGHVVNAPMAEGPDGEFVATRLVPSTGVNLLRLHRGRQMVAMAIEPPSGASSTFTAPFLEDSGFFVENRNGSARAGWTVTAVVLVLGLCALTTLVRATAWRSPVPTIPPDV